LHHWLEHGHFLKINLFANFGTPMLGEPVVCPFAPHAITYQLMAAPAAMVVNKAVLAALSVVALTAFFAAYVPRPVASIAAVLMFVDPAFYRFFTNHPHQGALLYFSTTL